MHLELGDLSGGRALGWLQDRAVLHSHGGTFSITGAGMWHHFSEQLLSLLPTDENTAPGDP